MAEKSGQTKAIDAVQTIIVLATIPFGLIPLVRWIFSDDHGGLFRTVFGEHTGTMGTLLPIFVIIGAIILIGALELAKKRNSQN